MDRDLAPFLPAATWHVSRVEEQRLRRRLLLGVWRADLALRISQWVGPERAEAWRTKADISINVAADVARAMGVLYDVDPTVLHADPDAVTMMTEILRDAGYTPIMQSASRTAMLVNESVVCVEVLSGDGEAPELSIREVPADLVIDAVADRRRPGQASRVVEARILADDETGEDAWFVDVWDVRGAEPYFRRYRSIAGVSGIAVQPDREIPGEEVVGVSRVGADYPYRDDAGRAVVPYIVYHRLYSDDLWNPFLQSELIEGTFRVAAFNTQLSHVMHTAGWPQRYMIGAKLATALDASGAGATAVQRVVADPATVLVLDVDPDSNTTPQVGQWQQPADPEQLQRVITKEAQELAHRAGLPAAEATRSSGDPRSGYALEIDREGRRQVQRTFEPTFRRSDSYLLPLVAIIWRAAGGDQLPTSGWSVAYNAIPLSIDEQAALATQAASEVAAGLISPAEYRMRVLGETREQAEAALAEISRGAAPAEPAAPQAPEVTP